VEWAVSARLFVVAGPSGVGKGTVIRRALERLPRTGVATSATTRPRRPDERDGREYHFLTAEEFARRVAAGDFLEHVIYAGNRYGTLRSEVDRRLASGESVVLEIEVVGAREIKRRMPDAVLVFVLPPAMEDLEKRLASRNTDPPEVIARRLEIAREEMTQQDLFDHTIVNDRVECAADELARLIQRETAEETT
jgi:guanylate kinase